MDRDVIDTEGGGERLQNYRYYVERAQASVDAAKTEKLPQRMRIHLEAARRWTSLAEKAAFIERLRSERAREAVWYQPHDEAAA